MEIDFLHVGLPKTGTTVLQEKFFKLHPDMHVIVPSHPINALLKKLWTVPEDQI